MSYKVKIAVSACLLGQKVRYDAQEKSHTMLLDFFRQYSDILEAVPFCPEVAIGLGVPRAKIQLVREYNNTIRVIGVEDHTLDVTSDLQSYAKDFLQQHPDISTYIVKSKSPSCGYQSSPLYKGSEQLALTSGLFVQTLNNLKSDLLIIEESRLNSKYTCLQLLKKIQNLC